MGISGLLPQLKSIQQPVTLHRYRSQTLAIDGYAWLHRSAHACAVELCLGLPTDKYLQFFVKKLTMLRNQYGIEPYLVFDGDSIQVKSGTETKRREKREENRAIAIRLWESGDRRKCVEYFQKCVDITPEMTKVIIDYCATAGFKYLVAPYEADPQLVYLEKSGMVSGVISEDSDLLVFGCRRLITKLNEFGECIEISRGDFHHLPSSFPLGKLDDSELRTMVCLSGCDYTAGIPKVGLLTAIKLVRQYRSMDKILMSIRREGKRKIPSEFVQEYTFADYAFQYQRVYCPVLRKLVTLNEIPKELRDDDQLYCCIGKGIHKETGEKCVIKNSDLIDHKLHSRIAAGELSPYNYHHALVNREMLLLRQKFVSLGTKPIDSYWKKCSAKETISATVSTASSTLTVGTTNQDRLDRLVRNRKLLNTESTNSPQSSIFFKPVVAPSAKPLEAPVATPQNKNCEKMNNEPGTCSETEGEVTEELIVLGEELNLLPPTLPLVSLSPKKSVQDLSSNGNHLDKPYQKDTIQSTTLLDKENIGAEDVSEILEELEEVEHAAKHNDTSIKFSKELLANFRYRVGANLTKHQRVPLGERSTNCKILSNKKLVITKLNKRLVSRSLSGASAAPLRPRSSVEDLEPQMISVPCSTNNVQKASGKRCQRLPHRGMPSSSSNCSRQLSLTDFIYRG